MPKQPWPFTSAVTLLRVKCAHTTTLAGGQPSALLVATPAFPTLRAESVPEVSWIWSPPYCLQDVPAPEDLAPERMTGLLGLTVLLGPRATVTAPRSRRTRHRPPLPGTR